MNYTASWPKEVKYFSFLFCICLIMGAIVLEVLIFFDEITSVPQIFPSVAYTLLILLPTIYAPTGYVLHSEGMVLKRTWKPIHLSFVETASISVLPKRRYFSMRRLFGSSCVYGYFGYFRDKQGPFFAMFTDRSKLIELKMKNGKRYFISPDNRDQFMEELTKAAPHLVK